MTDHKSHSHANRPRTIDNTNRRTSSRVHATFAVRYKTLDSLVSAYTENISKGGIYVRTDKLLPVNAMVKIKLVMPNDGPEIECIGQVARVHQKRSPSDPPTGMAVVFRDMSDDHRLFIESYIEHMSTQELTSVAAVPPQALHILVVDDDATVRSRASRVLRENGHRVSVAEDGLSALAACLKDPPDLVLTDVQMPKMDGWNFLKTVRSRASLARTLVVFQTSLSSEKDRLFGYQLGVDDYLAKPYSDSELLARINRLVQRNFTSPSIHNPGSKSLRGDIEQVSLPTVLSLLEMEQKTGVVVVAGPVVARIFIRDGQPVHIEMEGPVVPERPVDQMMEILSWSSGQFEFTPQDVSRTNVVGLSMQGLLMEAVRCRDEATKSS